MHYLSILTVRFEATEITYSAPLVFISLFVAMLSAYAALVPVSLPLPEGFRSFLGAVVVTMGISSLHFIGLSAMYMDAVMEYDYTLLLISILFALAGCHFGFRLFVYERFRRVRFRIAWSALWVGVSMIGMHFLAIEGTAAIPIEAGGGVPRTGLDEGELLRTVAVVLSVVFTLTFTAYHFARRAAVRLETLHENETLYYNAFSGSVNAMLIFRPDDAQTIAEANEQACKLLGRSKEELLGAPLGQVVPERDRRHVNDASTGIEEEWNLTSEEGGLRLASAIAGFVEIDERTKYPVMFLKDITSLKLTRMITGIFRPLQVLTVSGMPSHLLLPILQHLTPSLFPDTAIRFDPATGVPIFEPSTGTIPLTRDIVSWDGTILGRLTLTRKSASRFVPDGMEEVWLDKCADLLEISISSENGMPEEEQSLDTWVGVLNEELRFEFVGPAADALLGYEPEQLERSSLPELFHPDDLKMFLLRVRRAEDLKDPYRLQVRLLHKDGTWVGVHMILAASVRQEHAKIVFMTQRPAAERKLDFRYDAPEDDTKITKREKEVIRLINRGMSNKEIATELEISENTVKNHISNIFAKLSISDRNQVPMLLDCPADQD